MSEIHTHQGAPVAQHEPSSHAPEQAAEAPKKLSVFLKVSIILLIGLTVAAISLLFIGDFEGRFERVFATFVLFAIFVVLTAIDTNRELRNSWYAPVALIANTYILALLLVVIWMTPYRPYSLTYEIFWKSLLVILVTRLVIVCCEVLLRAGEKAGEVVNRFAFITSVLAVLSGILFTAPAAIEAFSLYIPDLYWRIATSVLILTALGLSVTLLLRWASTSAERAERSARAAQVAESAQAAQAAQAAQPTQALPQQPATPAVSATPVMPATPAAPAATAVPAVPAVPAAPAAPAAGELLPWPTFADGRPIPAGPDGQPDFSVPGAPRPPHF